MTHPRLHHVEEHAQGFPKMWYFLIFKGFKPELLAVKIGSYLIGHVDNCQKEANFFFAVRHFTWLYRGSIQVILAKNQIQWIKFTPGTLQKSVWVFLSLLSHTRPLGEKAAADFFETS